MIISPFCLKILFLAVWKLNKSPTNYKMAAFFKAQKLTCPFPKSTYLRTLEFEQCTNMYQYGHNGHNLCSGQWQGVLLTNIILTLG